MSQVPEVLDTLKAKGMLIATAESCTGGMIAAALTDVAGSSAVVDRGFVTYSNEAKVEMLGVKPSTLLAHGAVSEEVACEMAQGALARSRSSIAVSVTGIAGPGGSEHKPEGRVCFGVALAGQPAVAKTIDFGALGRDGVRTATVEHALALVLKAAKSVQAE
ncbi:MAG: nicotinamide-nucleotide amidohydrolase family protein [Pseudomonadota bacterium]